MLDATSPRDRRRRLLAVGWGIALTAALVVGPLASVALGADPEPTPTPTPTATPSPTTIAYRLNLLRSGDFIRQYTRYQCVGASLQIMRNMIWSSNNRGPTLQKRLWRIARSNSLYKADGGADAFGWTTATALSGHGRYVLVAAPTMAKAVAAAAKGMAATHRPAGLMVWRGTHAWVMTGFEATADPNATDEFRVVTIRMADPLWPIYHVAAHRVYRPGMRLYTGGALKKNPRRTTTLGETAGIEGRFVAIVPNPGWRSAARLRLGAQGRAAIEPDAVTHAEPDAQPRADPHALTSGRRTSDGRQGRRRVSRSTAFRVEDGFCELAGSTLVAGRPPEVTRTIDRHSRFHGGSSDGHSNARDRPASDGIGSQPVVRGSRSTRSSWP